MEQRRDVGVENPYEHAGVCDHLTDDGRCRLSHTPGSIDSELSITLHERDGACIVAAEESTFADCPEYRATDSAKECRRCGLAELRMGVDADARPLIEEHHLAYPDEDTGHEITVGLCRWCHAKVHDSWARIDDDVSPPTAAIAEKESRRAREQSEAAFETAAERFDRTESKG